MKFAQCLKPIYLVSSDSDLPGLVLRLPCADAERTPVWENIGEVLPSQVDWRVLRNDTDGRGGVSLPEVHFFLWPASRRKRLYRA